MLESKNLTQATQIINLVACRPGIEGTAPAVADEACVETTMELACADVVRNFVYMGYTEHVTIRELDLDTVR